MMGIEWGEKDRVQQTLPALRKCDRCGKDLPFGHPVEVCADCAKFNPEYSSDPDFNNTAHPGHPSNYGSR